MTYSYNQQQYETVEQVNNAVAELKVRLDNNPTDWCVVKVLSGNAEDGWTIPTETLSDSEIGNLSEDSYYSVSSIYDGTSYVGVSGNEASQKVREMRTQYATGLRANTIIKEYAPTETDMSGYV